MRTALNRCVLAATGLALLAAGTWLATADPALGTRMPAWWPELSGDVTFLSPARVLDLRSRGWWTPTVLAASVAATALGALWCARQFHGGGRPLIALPAPGATVRARALEEAVARDAAALDGVARCRARVLAGRGRITVRLHLWLQPDTTPDAVLPGVTRLLGRAESAAAPCPVHGRVRLSARSHQVPHVR
ncbi:hypothetical protein E5083_05485 [Streptomyces bauhiniae]|uniref:Alkaline shock response membrane anchor protein AmaP n=1 Tax=Streptomyces bauhiniae TaxID=2340725 RepID=A0A4Z1D8A0_9ACTN|nr:hypothetical protein [Streptomyces bauhiniae]TGN79111.1 hypothetical protein E5083_05485 [Streptomyces bauhiniae]